MRHRIFIAVNLDEKIVGKIAAIADECQKKLRQAGFSGARFLSPENWHITISFLGYQDDNDILKIVRVADETAKNFPAQNVELIKLLYGPPGKTPRMIWLEGDRETSLRLGAIKNYLEDALENEGISFRREARGFHSHITLVRFDEDIKKDSLPPIARILGFKSSAATLDIMESELKRVGARYAILQKFPFGA